MRKIYSILIVSICIASFMNSNNSLILDENFKDSVRWTSHQQIANDKIFEWHSLEDLG